MITIVYVYAHSTSTERKGPLTLIRYNGITVTIQTIECNTFLLKIEYPI